ncbi:MAG: hypothetical protein NDJ90_14880 [Oligoflexia bacterium]|nr:hypothetical protein [Oligoflexia bacterium]
MLLTALAAAAGILLSPFGELAALPGPAGPASVPWHGFDSSDASRLVLARVEKVSGACAPWLAALPKAVRGEAKGGVTDLRRVRWGTLSAGWNPFNPEELRMILECNRFPCQVKLRREEALQLKSLPPGQRLGRYQKFVEERARQYLEKGIEPAYGDASPSVSPWAYLAGRGLPDVPAEGQRVLWSRKFNLAPGEMKAVRQLVDVRAEAGPTSATVWLRDAYSDHYFDAWGEWARIDCGPDGKTLTVMQALMVDFDLLKKKGLLSQLSHGKLREAVRDQGRAYLDRTFVRLRILAGG